MTQGRGQSGDGARARGGSLPRVLLASKSPRRRELLSAAGVEHEATHPGVDDGTLAPGGVKPEQWVMALAYLKAATALKNAAGVGGASAPVVLGADTVVVHLGKMLGQPRDEADARRMLYLMRDDVHDVVTGVALIDVRTGRREMFVDRAVVRVGPISDAQIEEYLASGEWRGKAGAYNLSERLEAGWPIEFEGDAGTIMGLPVGRVVERLGSGQWAMGSGQ